MALWLTLPGLALAIFVFLHAARPPWAPTFRTRVSEVRVHGGDPVTGMDVAMATQASVDFELRREDGFDRVAKAMGLVVERQVGDVRFDPELARGRAGLMSAASLGVGARQVRHLVCRDRRVTRMLATHVHMAYVHPFVAIVEQRLPPVVERLDAAAGPPRHDRRAARAAWFVVLSRGLLRYGAGLFPGLLVMGKLGSPWPWQTALQAALGALVFGLLATRVLLGRGSRTHRVLRDLVLFGAPGVFLVGLVLSMPG